jgi:hypothetical protein
MLDRPGDGLAWGADPLYSLEDAVQISDRIRSMRIEAVPLGLALLAMLAGCVQPTPYQPAVDGYGYSEQQIEDNRFWVRFAGNDRTPAGTVQNYWLYRMAELTLDHGYDHFIVVDRKLDRSTTYEGTAQCDCPGYVTEDGDYVGGGGSVSSYSASPSDRYTAFADAVMFEGEKPAADVNAYDARSVLRQLRPTIEAAPGVARRTIEQPDSQPQEPQQ